MTRKPEKFKPMSPAKLKPSLPLEEGELRYEVFTHADTAFAPVNYRKKQELSDVQMRLIGKKDGKYYVAQVGVASRFFDFGHPLLITALVELANQALQKDEEARRPLMDALVSVHMTPILPQGETHPAVYWAHRTLAEAVEDYSTYDPVVDTVENRR